MRPQMARLLPNPQSLSIGNPRAVHGQRLQGRRVGDSLGTELLLSGCSVERMTSNKTPTPALESTLPPHSSISRFIRASVKLEGLALTSLTFQPPNG